MFAAALTGCVIGYIIGYVPMAERAPVPPARALRTVLGMSPHPPNPPIRADRVCYRVYYRVRTYG